MSTSKTKKIKAADFDKDFEQGKVIDHPDLTSVKARYPMQRISIDFPKIILEEIDVAAAKIGVTRTALIKMWVASYLSNHQSAKSG